MARQSRVHTVHRIQPGARADRAPGARLTCAVLSTGPEEWVGVDLASGAFLRARPGAVGAPALPGEWSPFDVVVLEIGEDTEPPDPARPEVVAVTGTPERTGRLRRRVARRLLRQLCAPEQQGRTVLGTRGPSIAYVDLDVSTPSLVVVETSPRLFGCYLRDDGNVACSFSWAGTTQSLPLLDGLLRAAVLERSPRPPDSASIGTAVGGKPGFLLVGLTAVRAGHAPKAVLSVLPR